MRPERKWAKPLTLTPRDERDCRSRIRAIDGSIAHFNTPTPNDQAWSSRLALTFGVPSRLRTIFVNIKSVGNQCSDPKCVQVKRVNGTIDSRFHPRCHNNREKSASRRNRISRECLVCHFRHFDFLHSECG
jgi:hypothetical protein